MAAAKISSQGQVTIPIEVRRWLGVKPGEWMNFVHRNGEIVVRSVRSKKDDPFAKYIKGGLIKYFPVRARVGRLGPGGMDATTDLGIGKRI